MNVLAYTGNLLIHNWQANAPFLLASSLLSPKIRFLKSRLNTSYRSYTHHVNSESTMVSMLRGFLAP